MEDLQELYIKGVADKKKINKKDVVILIDKCIKSTAESLKVSYASVHDIIYSMEFMASQCEAMKGSCSSQDIESCKNSCWCVYFDGKCYSRYFKDAKKMNEDPDKYLIGMPTEKLVELVKISSYLYYNYDGGGITDNTFDAFEYILNKRLKIKGRRYDKIGAIPVEKIRRKLDYPMPSLNKVKPGTRELMDFLKKMPDMTLWWSAKLDGVSCMISYLNGKYSLATTRGDGIIGGDVTYLMDFIKPLPIIKDPKYKNIVIRGEFIIKRNIWEQKYKKDGKSDNYSNPRSFVSSRVNSGHIPATGILDIEFVSYEIINIPGIDEIPSPYESMRILELLGFTIVENGILKNPTTFDIISLYKNKRKTSEYTIDGLVLAFNIKSGVSKTLTNPTEKIAFKMRLEEQIRQTKILDIEWNVSRYGRMIPVAIYESVYLDGVRLHRASAFNAGRVKEWGLGKGSIIKVIRSGDVIPAILSVEEDANITAIYPKPIVPGALGADKGWHWDKKDIIINDINNNIKVQLKRSEHFFSTIGVPRLKEKTLEKLWDAGIRSIKGITNAKIQDFEKIKGIGKKTATNLYTSIHSIMRNTRLDRFIPASTTLNLGIGRKLIKQLLNYHPTLMEDSPEVLKIILTKKNIPGIGQKRIDNIVENIEKFKKFLFALNPEDISFAIKKDSERIKSIASRGYNKKIRGKIFVMTGFFGKVDYELEDYIYDHYGSFSDSVTTGVEVVVAANLMEVTSKMLEAEKKGIKVLSVDEFITNYDIPRWEKTEVNYEDD